MMRYLITPLLLLFTTSAYAHDEAVEDTGPWSNNFALGYNQTSGNADTSLLNLKLTSVYEEGSDIFRTEAEHSFGENENTTNIDYSKALAEYKRLYSDRFYSSAGATYLRDEIADVKYRVTLNPALGYFLSKNDDGFFSLEAGPSYLWEEVAGITDDYLSPRIAYRFERKLTETTTVFSNADLLLSADDSDNYIVQSEHGIATAISQGLNLIVKLRDNYDNQPAAGFKRNDMALLTSVGVDF